MIGRHSGELRLFVCNHTDQQTCLEVVGSVVIAGSKILVSSDEWGGYRRVAERFEVMHRTVRHAPDADGNREWARDDDGDGRNEVHCNSCEGSGAALRTYLRHFRGVHKEYLGEYCACYETMFNAKRISPDVIQRMCFWPLPMHAS